jgi:hypothetical protein
MEANSPAGSPGPVLDTELVVRVVPVALHLEFGPAGEIVLAPAAISREHLSGRNGKSFSVLREPHTSAIEIMRRALLQNRQSEWANDPVLARAKVEELRSLCEQSLNWRMVCVNADPTGKEDPLGPCPTHASVLRSNPQPSGPNQRMGWLLVQAEVAAKFTAISHVSGTLVTGIP